ncbi:MAG: hypothetical protein WCT23_03235 [Candidatus Neomarinimicrobiota bacterium]
MSKTQEILQKNRKIAETGIFLALFLGLAYAFCYIPNLEFISMMAFLSGLLLGWKRGLFVALIGEAVFSIANPFGSSLAYPSLLVAQLLSFAIFALIGASYRLFIIRVFKRSQELMAVIFGATGLLLTILYNVMTTLAYALTSGFNAKQALATIISSIPFSMIQMIANTISFSVILTYVIKYVIKNYPHFLEKN